VPLSKGGIVHDTRADPCGAHSAKWPVRGWGLHSSRGTRGQRQSPAGQAPCERMMRDNPICCRLPPSTQGRGGDGRRAALSRASTRLVLANKPDEHYWVLECAGNQPACQPRTATTTRGVQSDEQARQLARCRHKLSGGGAVTHAVATAGLGRLDGMQRAAGP
jgi:hypothetical protein